MVTPAPGTRIDLVGSAAQSGLRGWQGGAGRQRGLSRAQSDSGAVNAAQVGPAGAHAWPSAACARLAAPVLRGVDLPGLIGAPAVVLVLLVTAPEVTASAELLDHRDSVDSATRRYIAEVVLEGRELGPERSDEITVGVTGPSEGVGDLLGVLATDDDGVLAVRREGDLIGYSRQSKSPPFLHGMGASSRSSPDL